MASVGGIDGGGSGAVMPDSTAVDFSVARAAYLESVNCPLERHAEVGVLFPSGVVTSVRLGIDEAYGAHRVGSVTKTFTTFLAMSLLMMEFCPKVWQLSAY